MPSGDKTPFPKTLSLAVHEFRTPVTVVGGYLRMVLREQAGPISEKQRKMLDEAANSCGRIAALIEQMSELGKMEAGSLPFAQQDVDLGLLLTEVASRMHQGDDRGGRVEVRGPDQPAIMTGDRTRLSEAFASLMHSALRERGGLGPVVAEWSRVDEDGAPWAVVAIGDPSLLPSLAASRPVPPVFDEWIGGLGFALPLARRMIEAHGGTVWSADGSQSRAASAARLPLRV